MVTKLRSFSTHRMTKISAFILFVFFITAAVLQILLVDLKGMDTECLFVQEYKDSKNFTDYIKQSMYQVMSGQDLKRTDFEYYYQNKYKQVSSSTPNLEVIFSQSYTRAYYSDSFYGWIYVAVPQELMQERQLEWEANRAALSGIICRGIAFAVFGFLLLAFLIGTVGLVPRKYGIHLSRPDHIFSEFIFAVFGISTAGLIYIIYTLLYSVSPFVDFDKENATAILTDYYSSHIIRMINISTVTAVLTAVSGLTLLSLVRQIKAGKLTKYSLFYRGITKGYAGLKELYKILIEVRISRCDSLIKVLYNRQQVLIALSLSLTLLGFLLSLFVPALLIADLLLQAFLMYWYFRGNKTLYKNIDSEFNKRLAEQMKAERMKVDLVTNVSHDLKTPLTSIISYLELLKKEDGLTETAENYVKILQMKSERLKNIVTDLFELAKSTSGDVVLDIQVLDMKKLIEQTLADMGDRIEASGLQLKVNLPDHSVNVSADGKKLYRVFQNVIDNALKYSLKGTRIFVDLTETDSRAVAAVKNTAGYEMDFSAEEILQRFTRGDKSRTTEGSGLGLSIAESFTKVCGGNLRVEIEGDMFKVMIEFAARNHIDFEKE